MLRRRHLLLDWGMLFVVLLLAWQESRPVGQKSDIGTRPVEGQLDFTSLIGGVTGCRNCAECCFGTNGPFPCIGGMRCVNAPTYYQCNLDTGSDIYNCSITAEICNAWNQDCNIALECFCSGP
jgi:hypothetical protein